MGIFNAVPIIGDIMGQENLARAGRRRSSELNRIDQELYSGLEAPDTQVGKTAYDGIAADPRYEQAQLDALKYLSEIGRAEGLTAVDKAQLLDIQRQQAMDEQGQRNAILQHEQQRGTLTGGGALGAQLLSQQASANRAQSSGLNVAAMAQKRALEAMMNAGRLGGEARGQDFDEQARIAQAKDIRDTFNATQMGNQFDRNMSVKGARQGLQQGVVNSDYDNVADVERSRAGMRGFVGNVALTAATGGFGGPAAAAAAAAAAAKKK